MTNDNVPYKRGTSTRQNGYGSRLPLFLCLALIVLCLLLIYNLYDVISQRDQCQGELADSRVQFRSCSVNMLECERKYELSKNTKAADDSRISQLERSNNEYILKCSQNEQLKRQVDEIETKNQDLNREADSLRERIKTLETNNQSLTSHIEELTNKLRDADDKLNGYKNNDDHKETELKELKEKLAASQRELMINCKQALSHKTAKQLSSERPDGWSQLNNQDKPSAGASAAIENEVRKVGDQSVDNSVNASNSDSAMPLAPSVDAHIVSVENLKEPLPPSASGSASEIVVPASPAPVDSQTTPMPPSPADFQTTPPPPPPLVDGDNDNQLESTVDKSKTDAPGDEYFQSDNQKDQ